MRVCVMNEIAGTYSLVNPEYGRVASYFSSHEEAVEYATTNGWEVF